MKSKCIKLKELNCSVILYEVEEKINGEIFRKNMVVDLRFLDQSKVLEILNNYKLVQMEIANSFNWYNSVEKNDRLFYLYDENIKDIILEYQSSITKDTSIYPKEFIDESKFEKQGDKNIVINNGNNIMVGNININTSGFNLIYGPNGSGKTVLLRHISDFFDVPVFNYYSKDMIKLDNDKVFMDYYKKLTGKNDITNYTGIDDVYYGICNGLTYGVLTDNIVIFDDLGWGLMDDDNQKRIIDVLNEYSYNNGIVMTNCQEDVKKLVKNRVYNPNIIDL